MHSCAGRICILDVGNKGGKNYTSIRDLPLTKRFICPLASSHHPGF